MVKIKKGPSEFRREALVPDLYPSSPLPFLFLNLPSSFSSVSTLQQASPAHPAVFPPLCNLGAGGHLSFSELLTSYNTARDAGRPIRPRWVSCLPPQCYVNIQSFCICTRIPVTLLTEVNGPELSVGTQISHALFFPLLSVVLAGHVLHSQCRPGLSAEISFCYLFTWLPSGGNTI